MPARQIQTTGHRSIFSKILILAGAPCDLWGNGPGWGAAESCRIERSGDGGDDHASIGLRGVHGDGGDDHASSGDERIKLGRGIPTFCFMMLADADKSNISAGREFCIV